MAFGKATKQADTGGSMHFPLMEAGGRHARVIKIVDLGLQPGSAIYPEAKHKMRFVFELMEEFGYPKAEDGTVDLDSPITDKPVWRDWEVTYNPNGHISENSNIYPIIAALSPSFAKTGEMTEELGDLLGRACNVMIATYVKSKGKRKGQEDNKITGVSAMTKNEYIKLTKMVDSEITVANLKLVGTPVFFDFDKPTKEAWAGLTGGFDYSEQYTIRNAMNYRGSKVQLMLEGAIDGEEEPTRTVDEAAETAALAKAAEAKAEAAKANKPAVVASQPATASKITTKQVATEVAQTETEIDDIF